MVVYHRHVQPQSCQHTGKFAKLWKRNFSLDNLDGLVLTCLKPGILYFGASCLLQRFSNHDPHIDLLFSEIVFLLSTCSSWYEVLENVTLGYFADEHFAHGACYE